MHFVTILNHIILISDSIHWRWYIIETGPVWIETFLNKNVFYHNNCVTFYLENTISEKWVLYCYIKPFYEWIWCLGFISALWWRPPRVQMEYLQKNEYFPYKTVIIDDSLQNTLEEKKMPSVIWKLLISLPTGTAIILSFMKLVIFLINIPFEHGEDVTIRRWWTPNIRSIHRMA